MTATIKREKEAFLLNQLKKGERTGMYLEAELRKSFPGSVSNRFRSEMEGLIKSGQVLREGTGSSAVFKLARQKARSTQRRETAVASTRKPDPVPVVEKPAVQEFDADQVSSVVAPALRYLARNGDREFIRVMQRANPDQKIDLEMLETLVLMVKRGLVEAVDETVTITREGYKCLDTVLAGESFS